ncbi:hypothetical protein [Calothrix sp. 336/3]|nr:hypothetical protein IJ00_23550 [Calothrix sp. 336/3]
MGMHKLSLVLATVALGCSAIAYPVKAENLSSSPLLIAQDYSGKKSGMQDLGLSPEQKAKIKAIRQATREEIQKRLTPEQRQQWQTMKQNRQGGKKGEGWRSLNLSETQKTEIRQLMESQKSQINAVLTEEQRQKLEQSRQARRDRRQQNRPNN